MSTKPTKGVKFAGYLFVHSVGFAATWGAETPYALLEDGGSGELIHWCIGDRLHGMSGEQIASMLKPFAGTPEPIWVEAFLYTHRIPNALRTMRRVQVTI